MIIFIFAYMLYAQVSVSYFEIYDRINRMERGSVRNIWIQDAGQYERVV